MATSIPAKLKTLDISRFAQRGSQLERFKPPVAYWCYYWVVNQILSKGLHSADEECKRYTTNLMDKLEEMKTSNSTDVAILEDAAGQQFVERFGLQTFDRAENAMRADKATMQTVETFHAASTFLDVLQIWNPPGPELTQKIKYAKYHALRIAKALKAGEDPNLSNPPPPEPVPSLDSIQLDPDDPEVQKINGTAKQTSVEDGAEENNPSQPNMAAAQSFDQLVHPSQNISSTPQSISADTDSNTVWQPPASSPEKLEYFDQTPSQPPSTSDIGPTMSTGNSAPVSPPSPNPPVLPQAPISPAEATTTPLTRLAPPPQDQQDLHNVQSPAANATPLPPSYPPPSSPENFQAQQHYASSASQPHIALQQPHGYVPPPLSHTSPPLPHYPQPAPQTHVPPQSSLRQQTFNADEQSMADAQKHAKWAISALNFEDVNTAVKELKIALKALGAE